VNDREGGNHAGGVKTPWADIHKGGVKRVQTRPKNKPQTEKDPKRMPGDKLLQSTHCGKGRVAPVEKEKGKATNVQGPASQANFLQPPVGEKT